MIKFKNEDTFGKFQRSGKEHDFHKKYEEAITMIGSQFGRKYTSLLTANQSDQQNGFRIYHLLILDWY